MVTLDLCDEIIVHHSSASSVEIAPAYPGGRGTQP